MIANNSHEIKCANNTDSSLSQQLARTHKVTFSDTITLGAQIRPTVRESTQSRGVLPKQFNNESFECSINSQAYTACAHNDTLQPCNTLLGSIDRDIGHKEVGQDSDNLGSWVLSEEMDKNSLLYVETAIGKTIIGNFTYARTEVGNLIYSMYRKYALVFTT